MKAIKCQLILHGSCKQLDGGIHESKTAAKKWVSECWDRPYSIVPIPVPKPPVKDFNLMYNIGRSKYVVNHHNGVKTYVDGSPFYDIAIFKNKKKLNAFARGLKKDGYVQTN